MGWFLDLTIVRGWALPTLTALGAAGLLWLVSVRSRRFLLVVVPAVLIVGASSVFVAHLLIDDALHVFPDPIPAPVYLWSAVILAAVVLAAIRLIGPRWSGATVSHRGRAVTAISLLLVVAAGMGQINAEFGKFPTVRAVLGQVDVETTELPPLDPSPVPLAAWQPLRVNADRGKVATVPIPGTASGFAARPAKVYLPPAYFTEPRPLLPVIVLIAGQPGSPEDWIVSAGIVETLDEFAAGHNGVAPIVIAADGTGTETANPLCLDSHLGNAATYLTTDVATWAEKNLNAETDRKRWAVGGLSYGGTCALQLVVNHPDVYPTFLNMSGQWEPTLGDRNRTVEAAFGGDVAAFTAINPVDLMHRRKYPGVTGVFLVGTDDHEYRPGLQRVYETAQQSGMDVTFHTVPGGHDFTVWAAGLRRELPWLAQQLGIR